METVSVSLPPPLPPKTRKKPCGGQQLRAFQESGRGPDSVQCRYTDAAPVAAVAAPHSGAGADRVHVVSIRIRPEESICSGSSNSSAASAGADGCVRISVGGTTPSPPPPSTAVMVARTSTTAVSPSPPDAAAFLFYNGVAMTTSGQASPVDSGTCSDDAADAATPPPLPRKTSTSRLGVRVTVNSAGPEDRFHSDPEDERCSSTMSCDSLNSLDKVACFLDDHRNHHLRAVPDVSKLSLSPATSPAETLTPPSTDTSLDSAAEVVAVRRKPAVDEQTYEDRRGCGSSSSSGVATPPDHYYDFHLNERDAVEAGEEEDTFAGCRDYTLDEPVTVPATIKSSKGTVRGVRNRVRAGVATFLSIQHNRSWKDKEAGKVVVFTTTMGVVRGTYQRCVRVKQILRTLLVRFDEKDVFMSREVQGELMERMRLDSIQVPQVFVEGQHVGDAETIERLNESGELRKMLKPYKSADACSTCEVCGGYRLLPCAVCNGSKKSVHRNNFTAELVALRCMNCDEVGLVKCYAC